MRTLLRLGFVALLIASCNSLGVMDPIGCVPRSPSLHIEPQSMRLVFGTVGEVVVYQDDGCLVRTIGSEDLDPIVRDPSVASLADPGALPQLGDPGRAAVVLPEGSGRTYLVVGMDGWADSVPLLVPDTVAIAAFVAVEAGAATSCGVAGDGTAHCWGFGGFALGPAYDHQAIGQCWGAPCSPFPVPRMTDATGVWVGSGHACAIDRGGQGWCWGGNALRQVVDRDLEFYDEPEPVSSGSTFAELRPGGRHTCGLTTAGEIECWGGNEVGQLGLGDTREVNGTPSLVEGGHVWVSLATGESTTCGVTDGSALLCWGYLAEQDVTIPGSEACSFTITSKDGPQVRTVRCATTPFPPPLAPEMGDDTLFVSVSGACALTTMGRVGCYDRLTGIVHAVQGPPPLVALSSFGDRACALTSAGQAWCWGSDALGDGRDEGGDTPVRVAGSLVFDQIAVGDFHTCALTVDEEAWCWGWNDVGQAGVSILDRPLTPTRVRGQS